MNKFLGTLTLTTLLVFLLGSCSWANGPQGFNPQDSPFLLINHHEQQNNRNTGILQMSCGPTPEVAEFFGEYFGDPEGTALGANNQYWIAVYNARRSVLDPEDPQEWVIIRYGIDGIACILAYGSGTFEMSPNLQGS